MRYNIVYNRAESPEPTKPLIITPVNKIGRPHGYIQWDFDDGSFMCGNFINGKPIGLIVELRLNDSCNYKIKTQKYFIP